MRTPFFLVAALAAGLAACGGGDRGSADEATTTARERQPERALSQSPAAPDAQPGPALAAPPSTAKPAPPSARELARRAVRAELAQRRLYVGFQDDPSFRWQAHRDDALTAAAAAGATVLRTTVEWHRVAPRRPADARDPFHPGYRLADVDELVRNAQKHGIEVLITIWGTPAWANGGQRPNRLPRRLRDLTDFAYALSARYSGRRAGYPFVRFFSVWNEPNLQQFLAPQFDERGRSLSPVLYARLFEAAAAGIRQGSPDALVAAGETSPRGRDRPREGIQDSHAPATFARLLGEAAPGLRFDAWAHHPYPTAPRRPPTQVARWPNVALVQVPRLAALVDRWFNRRDTPIWLTEYAYQTRPADPTGVTAAEQARFAAQALRIAAGDGRTSMFVWFTFRDDPGNPWQSGLVSADGERRPAFRRFAGEARPLDARVEVIALEPDGAVVHLGVRPFAHFSNPGAPVGVTFRLYRGRTLATSAQPRVPLGRDGWVTVKIPLAPRSGARYRIGLEANDRHGNVVKRELVLVAR
jgi:hypothetical protein